MENIDLIEMMRVREENGIKERMKFVMKLFGIKEKDVIVVIDEGEKEESLQEADLECFKKALKRSKRISTLEPYAKGIIKLAKDKCNEEKSEFLKKCYKELCIESIFRSEEYYNFRVKVNEYLLEEGKEQSKFYFQENNLMYLQGMDNDEIEEMERFQIDQSRSEFKENVKKLEMQPEKIEWIC